MNILITKMMNACFTTNTDRERLCGGFDAISYMFQRIAESYPQHTFYYIGASDLADSQLSTPENLKDLYTPIKAFAKEHGYDPIAQDLKNTGKPFYQACLDYCKEKGLKFDLALYQYEQTLPIAHYADGYISERTKGVLKTLVSQRHSAHAFVLASDMKVPLYLIVDDPRQINHIPADITPPVKIFAQCKGTDHTRYYVDKILKEEHAVPMEYAEIEKFYLLKKERVNFSNPDEIHPSPFETYKKDLGLVMTLNGNFDRLDYVRKWLFPYDADLKIYGRWDSGELAKKVESLGLTDRFVVKGMSEMEDVMWRSRYTLVAPPSAKTANFVTQKVYSMLYYGIMPFWAKGTYDIDNFYTDIPSFFKVETPDELWKKIRFLDRHPIFYRVMLRKCYDALKPEYFENDFVHRIFDCIFEK